MNLDSQTTALVLIDLQRGILALPLAPYDANRVVTNAAGLAEAFRARGAPVIRVHVDFAAGYADKPNQPVDVPMTLPADGLPAGFADFAPEIAAIPSEIVITKHQWSAFHGTELDLQLRRRGLTTVVLAGVATNFGVESTAREAWQLGYDVVVAADACTSVDDAMHRFAAEKILPRVSRVRSCQAIATALA